MISNTTYEVINSTVDCLAFWKPRLNNPENLKTVDPIYEYCENLKNYYSYLAWADERTTYSEDY